MGVRKFLYDQIDSYQKPDQMKTAIVKANPISANPLLDDQRSYIVLNLDLIELRERRGAFVAIP